MEHEWSRWVARWAQAGLLDEAAVGRIRAFEAAHGDAARLRWPMWLALAFGALMLGAGVLLFVSAHWDTMSPGVRFGLVLLLVSGFHVVGAALAERSPGLATALHAVGTMALGAGIFLAGQIFNLDEHWPGGLLMWAIGAAVAWIALKTWPQMTLTAILAPAWLCGEWMVATQDAFTPSAARVAAGGVFLLALAYFTAERAGRDEAGRRPLVWLGAIAFVPAALAVASLAGGHGVSAAPPIWLSRIGWLVAFGLPMAVGVAMHGRSAWPIAAAAAWLAVLLALDPLAADVWRYAWWAAGAAALAAWGVADAKSERINLGAAVFAATVLAFYFSHVMDKLQRSASLVGLGVVFLAGGWAVERARRHLVLQTRGGRA